MDEIKYNSGSSGQQRGTDTPFNRDEWLQRRQQERQEIFDTIDKTALRAASEPEMLQTFLDVQARFDRYSVGNALLISAQMPSATKLASYNTWHTDNISIKKGASAISILEPGKEYTRADGTSGTWFEVKKVFDISQTTAWENRSPAASRDARLLLKGLIKEAPCSIKAVDGMPGGKIAAYDEGTDTIYVSRTADAPSVFREISREIAHVCIGGDGDVTDIDFSSKCISYILCRRCNIPPEPVGDIPTGIGMDARKARSELSTVRTISNAITDSMERYLSSLEHSREEER